MTQKKLKEILAAHSLYLRGYLGDARADLSGAKLSGADLSGADLSEANLSGADLSRADLSWSKLSEANLSGADLSWSKLPRSKLSGADLSRADLSGAKLSGANLSGAKGLTSAADFLKTHFEQTEAGFIAYKTFNSRRRAPSTWSIEKGSIIEENVNCDRCTDCGCGINVAPIEWVKRRYSGAVWKVLIRWEWLAGVCVPYMSDGKIRCERVELLEIVKEAP